MNELTIVLPELDNRAFRRARDAYLAGTPIPSAVQVLQGCWHHAIHDAAGDLIVLADPGYEPHPGWFDAGMSAAYARAIAAPTIWTHEGVPLDDGHDWTRCAASAIPMFSRATLAKLAPFPADADLVWLAGKALVEEISFFRRERYAFTQLPNAER